jgi:hypothetical protein
MNLLTEQLSIAIGFPGCMISGSKSGYRAAHPDNFAIFNANICTNSGKIWFGDIDLTLKKEDLCELAKAHAETLYVLYEMDGRFENEQSPLLEKAAITFLPDGSFKVADNLVNYIHKSFFE